MNVRARPIVMAAALAACLALAQTPAWTASSPGKWGGKTYKWVDEHGITHYGDSIPPEYATQGRSELNKQGVEIRQVPRQLSGTEADKALKAANDQAKIRQHDSFLMTTYTSAKDIEQLRDERLDLINNQMETRARLGGLDQPAPVNARDAHAHVQALVRNRVRATSSGPAGGRSGAHDAGTKFPAGSIGIAREGKE